jgi:hypothetical protein
MPDQAPPSPELTAALRDQAFEALIENADLAASYARSIAEAAFRGEQVTAGVHLKQLRLCVLEMIQMFKALDDQDVAGKGPS